ncbi:MAG: ABC transporter ATP-binding protein, partial [Candidatus Rokubacteria bacterium]|nr:ABC transporter ATP-binding protein [Candidatus Rokubacteria bacterium]
MPEAEHDEILGSAFDRRLVARLVGVARPHQFLILITTLLFPLIAVVELAQPFLMKVAIDEHILRADWRGLTGVAGLFLAALLLLSALRGAESYLMHLTGQRVMHDLRG